MVDDAKSRKKKQIRELLEHIRNNNGEDVKIVSGILEGLKLNLNTATYLRRYGALFRKGKKFYVRESFVICDANLEDYYNNFHNPYHKDKKMIEDKTTSYILKEDECISFLKSLGYRILKPVTDYKEI